MSNAKVRHRRRWRWWRGYRAVFGWWPNHTASYFDPRTGDVTFTRPATVPPRIPRHP